MKQIVKAAALILFVSLLSGCSSSSKVADPCIAAEQAKIDYEQQGEAKFAAYRKEIADNKNTSNSLVYEGVELEANSKRVIVNYPQCFTPKQVVEAQNYLSKLK